jgi:hypothetical protein
VEVLRGQYPSRYAATLNKSQNQPSVATTITINSTVRLKRMRMRYARVPKTQTSVLSTLLKHLSFVDIPQAGATLKKDRPRVAETQGKHSFSLAAMF